MRTLIFRTISPYLTALMVVFSIFVLLRGHNEAGGGFIGGLIAASAFAIFGISNGVAPVRRAIYFHPLAIASFGLLMSSLAGMISVFAHVPFMTGIWGAFNFLGARIDISSILFFDIGVYLVVVGTITSIALSLEERERD